MLKIKSEQKKYPKLQILPRFSTTFILFAKIQSFFLQASVFRFICVFWWFVKIKGLTQNVLSLMIKAEKSVKHEDNQDGDTDETTDNHPSWSSSFWPLHNFIMKLEELSKLRKYLNFLFNVISRKNMTSPDKYRVCRCASVHLHACDYYMYLKKKTRQ